MNRNEFCSLLLEAKQDSAIKLVDLCAKMQMLPTDIIRIEQGRHNFNMKMCLNYLSAIQHHIVLSNTTREKHITDYPALVQYMIEQRSGKYTQRSLATKAGVTNIAIANMERSKSIVSIDTFLLLASALDIQIKIIANETK